MLHTCRWVYTYEVELLLNSKLLRTTYRCRECPKMFFTDTPTQDGQRPAQIIPTELKKDITKP